MERAPVPFLWKLHGLESARRIIGDDAKRSSIARCSSCDGCEAVADDLLAVVKVEVERARAELARRSVDRRVLQRF